MSIRLLPFASSTESLWTTPTTHHLQTPATARWWGARGKGKVTSGSVATTASNPSPSADWGLPASVTFTVTVLVRYSLLHQEVNKLNSQLPYVRYSTRGHWRIQPPWFDHSLKHILIICHLIRDILFLSAAQWRYVK